MARLARVVIPGVPHHIMHRGNRQDPVFFRKDDYVVYRDLVAEWCAACGVKIWAYCLMPTHVHLIAVPAEEDSLRRALGEAHRRYTVRVNQREDWRGYLWQGRFASFPLDNAYLRTAVRYVELNPVRARLVKRAEQYLWSSAAAHVAGRDDELVRVRPLLKRFGPWKAFLAEGLTEQDVEIVRAHERTGRPLGSKVFVASMEALTGRVLAPQKRGPKGPWKKKRKKK